MRRWEFILSSLCLAVSDAWAQSPTKPKLAILSPGSPSGVDSASDRGLAVFLKALRKLGYINGQDIELEFRYAEGHLDLLPALASELVNSRPNLIYTWTTPAAVAAAKATGEIPIVVGPAGERIMMELAGNLARPAGNVTGLTLTSSEQDEKCLELLKETAPLISRVGVLVNPANPSWQRYPDILSAAADKLGLALIRIESRGKVDINQTLSRLVTEPVDAFLLVDDAAIVGDDAVRMRVIDFARKYRLPSASTFGNYARDGGVLTLGTDHEFLRERAAQYVHRVIQGTRPSDLPVERPTRFRLIVNVRAATALGLEVPASVLVRADEVIE